MSMEIIKNYQALISDDSSGIRRDALDITEAAIHNAVPYDRTLDYIHIKDGHLHLGQYDYLLSEIRNLYVIGAGKGAYPIARAIEEKLEDYISEGVVLVKKGDTRRLKKIEIIESGHPIPDQSGIDGAGKILRILQNAEKGDVILAAITGGSSAMLNLPADEITLTDLQKISNMLLKSGADISQMNAVRKHLCLMKGGQLITYARPAVVYTFTLDTAPPGMPWPDLVLPDPTTFEDAIHVLKKYGLWTDAPPAVRNRLLRGHEHPELETPKSFEPGSSIIFSVADPERACEAAAKMAEQRGYHPYILSTVMEGEAKDLGIFFAGICNELSKRNRPFLKPCALITAGETTVTIRGGKCGMGGPNQETALGFLTKISSKDEFVCISVDSDGTDGPCDIAGGIVDRGSLHRARQMDMDISEVLLEHDSGNALVELGDAVITGHTGTNIMNLRVVLVKERGSPDGS